MPACLDFQPFRRGPPHRLGSTTPVSLCQCTQALIGWYEVPGKEAQEAPIEEVINPRGAALRSKMRVWNNGDGRLRLYTVGSGVPS